YPRAGGIHEVLVLGAGNASVRARNCCDDKRREERREREREREKERERERERDLIAEENAAADSAVPELGSLEAVLETRAMSEAREGRGDREMCTQRERERERGKRWRFGREWRVSSWDIALSHRSQSSSPYS